MMILDFGLKCSGKSKIVITDVHAWVILNVDLRFRLSLMLSVNICFLDLGSGLH